MLQLRSRLSFALAATSLIACDVGSLASKAPAGGNEIGSADAALGEEPARCRPLDDQGFAFLSTDGPPSDRPAAEHGDLNLHLRGWEPVQAERNLVDISGATDALAPKLNTMFADARIPTIVNTYAVHHWDWEQDQRAGRIEEPITTLVGFGVSEGETIALPRSGYDIGEGMQARVAYMDEDSMSLVYTRSDHVAIGYALHVAGICADPELMRLYQENDAAGRALLPALRGEQAFARARGDEVQVSIRDSGSFMDPRSRKDWW